MKTKIRFWIPATVLALFSVFLVTNCTKTNDVTTYSTSDFNGSWSGSLRIVFHGGDNDGLDTTYSSTFTFNSNGSLDSITGHPVFLTNSGNLSVSNEGLITGIITTTHNTDPGIETTSENWAGCSFESKTKININMTWGWTNTRPGEGYYLITGELSK
jgi:hypothetical protein